MSSKQVRRRPSRQSSRRGSFESLERRQMLAAHIAGSSTVYSTIQAAVDAAVKGSVITVDPGSYAEQVTIGKQLTLRGAQSGVDARSNARLSGPTAAESVITGASTSSGVTNAFYIAANDVTIDGFIVQGETSQSDVSGAGIVVAPQISGTRILNNIVQNNVSGMFLANYSSTDPAVIQHNVFRNNNNAGSDGGRAIYTNGGVSGGNLTNVTIDANAFLGNRGSSGTTGLEAALAFEALTAGKQSNVRITNNVFDGNGKATLFFNTVGVTITGNTITNALDQYSGTLRFEGNNQNVTIQNNTLYHNTGPAVAVDSKGVSGDNSGFVVTNNNFYFNSTAYGSRISVVFDGSVYVGTPDVRYNWWGDSSGPGGDGPGAGDKVYGIGHVVSGGQWYVATGGNELYSPWSSSPVGSPRGAYFGLPASDGANIQFEDYDHGGDGYGYHDTTSSNSGGKYRNREGVDIESTTDAGGGYDVYNVVAGEWLSYTVNLVQTGTFSLDTRLATAQTTGGKFHVEVDGVNVSGALSVPATGGSQSWKTLTTSGLSLTAGQHVLRFVFESNGSGGTVGSFNNFKLTNTAVAPPTVPAAPTNLTATAANSTTVNLTWSDNATSETGYIVERKSGTSGTYQQIALLASNASTFADTTAAASTSYTYRVRATNSAGDSANSNEATVTTPAAPSFVYVSDLTWVSATNGWGPVEKDQSVGGSGTGDGSTLTLNGVTYAKGLGTNSPSDVVYNLGGGYGSFLSDVGVDDHQTVNGTVQFQVYADNVLVFDSGVMTPTSATQSINVNVAGVQQLRLHVGDGGDGSDYDWGDWSGARLTYATSQPPPPTVQAPAAPTGLVASAASTSQINLTWSAVTNATSYKIERSADGKSGWTQVGTSTAAAYSDSTGLSAGTTYYYRVRASNSGGDSPYSAVASATTSAAVQPPPPTPSLPAGWTDGDIGAVGVTGGASYSGGTYTVTGAGAGIGGTADAFNYAYQSLTGNGSLVARVTSNSGVAGIMLRDGTTAGAKMASLTVSNGVVSFTRRTAAGGTASTTTVKVGTGATWLKLTRSGSTISAYRSNNGSRWTLIGSASISFSSTIYAGLCVASKSTMSTSTATMDNVSLIVG